MRKTFLAVTVAVVAMAQVAQASFTYTFTENAVIPDGSLVGAAFVGNVSGLAGPISDVNVTLNLSGGWNGDLYAYLVYQDQFAVLLNRVGRTAANPAGYSDAGMSVTLDDSALVNIHNYGGGAPSTALQPDGRNISPLSSGAVFDGTSPSTPLSAFNVANGNGDWLLFLADVSGGDVSTLTSWSLEIAAVPEPGSLVEGAVAVLLLGGMIGLYRIKGRRGQPQPC